MSEIDNTYRNFSFEVLAGAKDTLVEVKENGCLFRFDFAVFIIIIIIRKQFKEEMILTLQKFGNRITK